MARHADNSGLRELWSARNVGDSHLPACLAMCMHPMSFANYVKLSESNLALHIDR